MSRNIRTNFLTDKSTFGNSTMPIGSIVPIFKATDDKVTDNGVVLNLGSIVSGAGGGTGYTAGNILTFPDIGAYALSSESTQFRLRINTTSFGSAAEDAGAYTHNPSLHNVLPLDTNTDSAINAAYPQVSNIIETTEAFNYEEDPTRHTNTINYNSPLTNYQLNIPEVFIAVDGMSASINIQPESDTKIDSLIAPFVMVDYLIKT